MTPSALPPLGTRSVASRSPAPPHVERLARLRSLRAVRVAVQGPLRGYPTFHLAIGHLTEHLLVALDALHGLHRARMDVLVIVVTTDGDALPPLDTLELGDDACGTHTPRSCCKKPDGRWSTSRAAWGTRRSGITDRNYGHIDTTVAPKSPCSFWDAIEAAKNNDGGKLVGNSPA